MSQLQPGSGQASDLQSATTESPEESQTRWPEVAYYYPTPFWGASESGWAKSLLLFFDRLAILLPNYMHGRHAVEDPATVLPLEERGLLQVLEPNEWVDAQMTEQLAEVMVELLINGAFDDLTGSPPFEELSRSRIGYGADVGLAAMLVEELRSRDLAHPSEDGVSIPLHPVVHMTILVMLGQLSRVAGADRELVVHPVTNQQDAVSDLMRTLAREPMPSTGRMVALDLEPVSLDLSSIPIDDILSFKAEHGDTHRAYMRDLGRFMSELANTDDPRAREKLLVERREEIADEARKIQRSTRESLGENLASVSLGLAGAAWSATTGDLLGSVLGAAALVPSMIPNRPNLVTAYSYVFSVQRQLGQAVW
ncbi:MAG: hypothetical protein KTU85_06640 [Acidimicrobiia bacterium]|nr:hypothetical protein [Acidimicrobiia bacterium]MCY4458375.1 hypothetical protein [Acidimicrobiaceae bacterium]